MADQENKYLFSENEIDFIESLNKKNILKTSDVQKLNVILRSGKTDLSVIQLILNLGLASETDMLSYISQSNGLRILDNAQYPTSLFGDKSFNTQFLREQNVIVLSETDELIEICINDPFASGLYNAVTFALGNKYLKVRLGFKKDISEALDRVLTGNDDKTLVDKFDSIDEVLLEKDIQQLKELASEAPVIKIVNSIIQEAIHKNSSDIHIEPHNHELKVRNRIDGVLITVQEIQMNLSAAIVSRIKILSSLDIAQRRVPQDGRFDISIDGQDIDIRTSVIPTIHGESIVLRLLYKKSISFDFESLGYAEKNKLRILQMLDKPHGLILVTGPTGSGKSTTLYAMLQQINNAE
ncbi:MAG: Flp pilus assembly complex ATPase component TadA, partial [Gammaproteobacteria bacterium]|nr:Flp pilus assembly complex ATPase component TadA [Gammaproteobacteria bacterium]